MLFLLFSILIQKQFEIFVQIILRNCLSLTFPKFQQYSSPASVEEAADGLTRFLKVTSHVAQHGVSLYDDIQCIIYMVFDFFIDSVAGFNE